MNVTNNSVAPETHDAKETQWRVQDEVYTHTKYDPTSSDEPKPNAQENFVDLNFTDEISTGLELLEKCQHLYMRQPLSSNQVLPSMKRSQCMKYWTLMDFVCLYYLSNKSKGSTLKFIWHDYLGTEILISTVKLGGCACNSTVTVALPNDSEHVPPMGNVTQLCSCRPKYNLTLGKEKTPIFKFRSHKGQLIICPEGNHSPRDVDIVDVEDNDLVGKIFRVNGYIDFGGRGRGLNYTYNIPTTENFDGCSIPFSATNSGLGPETKALLVSAAILLNIQYFKKTCCGYGCCCLSCFLFGLIILILSVTAFIGLFSFFYPNQGNVDSPKGRVIGHNDVGSIRITNEDT